jgi:hypothetical protein
MDAWIVANRTGSAILFHSAFVVRQPLLISLTGPCPTGRLRCLDTTAGLSPGFAYWTDDAPDDNHLRLD